MEIYNAIQYINERIGAIGKEKKNTQQGFNYRGIDDVMNVLHPLLTEAKMFIWPEAIEMKRQERQSGKGGLIMHTIVKIKYHFQSTVDGSEVVTVVYGEGMDSGDKSTNKALAVAMKYACFQVFCIPTEELKDPDADSYLDVQPFQERYGGYYQ